MQFQEEERGSADPSKQNEESTDEPPPLPTTTPPTTTDQDNFSFPGSAFNHLKTTNDSNDSFMSLYDQAGGPPKPPRKNDSTFTGGPSGVSNVTFADQQDDIEEDVHI